MGVGTPRVKSPPGRANRSQDLPDFPQQTPSDLYLGEETARVERAKSATFRKLALVPIQTAPGTLDEQAAIAAGRRLLRKNLLTALGTGTVLLASGLFAWEHWLLGLLLGILYSNAFEYLYHRFLLHRESGRFSERHQQHHDAFGQQDEALHITFGDSPQAVGLLIAVNSLPFALLDQLGVGVGAGVVLGFVAYYALYEEIHWRIHLGGLPRRLEWMRRHHFAHHKGTPGRYNVFLPIFDTLLGWTHRARHHAR